MEWNSDSSPGDLSTRNSCSNSDNDGESPFTPEERVSCVNVEEWTDAVSKMHGLCLTPMIERSPLRSASRLRSGVQGRILFPPEEQALVKWSIKEMYALALFLMLHRLG